MIHELLPQLRAIPHVTIKTEEPLSKHTTWKIGGVCDLWIEPEHESALQQVCSLLHAHRIPVLFLGRGSNVLVSDDGFRGAVIKLNRGFDWVEFHGTTVRAGAGCSLIKLAALCARNGLSGFVFAGGIPGNVGGAVVMNAGAHGSDISQVLTACRVMTENGDILTLKKEDLSFRYRHSLLQSKQWVLLEATFVLEEGDKTELLREMAALKEVRKKTQPLQEACGGSVFRNPLPHYSGSLIERAGLKGEVIGRAAISPTHANFIVNTGGARAQDVYQLIQVSKQKVQELFSVSLTPEIKMIGDFPHENN